MLFIACRVSPPLNPAVFQRFPRAMQKLSGLRTPQQVAPHSTAGYVRTPQQAAPPGVEEESEPASTLALVLRATDHIGYFGSIHFPGYSRSASKFLRLPPDADAGLVVQVMMEAWKLTAPCAVLSMTPEGQPRRNQACCASPVATADDYGANGRTEAADTDAVTPNADTAEHGADMPSWSRAPTPSPKLEMSSLTPSPAGRDVTPDVTPGGETPANGLSEKRLRKRLESVLRRGIAGAVQKT